MTLDEKPRLIWIINILGALIFMVGYCALLISARNYGWWVLSIWTTLVILGLFMMAVIVPHTYPSRLLKFTWHDFIQPSFMTAVLVTMVAIPAMEKGQARVIFGYIASFWILWPASMIMIRLAGRAGTWLVRRSVKK